MSAFDHDETDHHDHDHNTAYEQRVLDRRTILRVGGMGLLSSMGARLTATGAGFAGGLLPSISLGATSSAAAGSGTQKTFVFVTMFGGADAIQLFPPAGDPKYHELRANKALPSGKTQEDDPTNLNGTPIQFGDQKKWYLNSNLAPLAQIPNLTLAPSVGVIDCARSHFDCWRWIEKGTKRDMSVSGGMLNRFMQARFGSDIGKLQAVAGGTGALPLSLQGPARAIAIGNIDTFGVSSGYYCRSPVCEKPGPNDDPSLSYLENRLEDLVRKASADDTTALGMTRRAQQVMLDAIGEARTAVQKAGTLRNTFTDTPQGRGLKLVAQLIKGKVPVSVATVPWYNMWDTHGNVGTHSWNLAVRDGADNLLAFYNELGPELMKNVVVLAGSEFGRPLNLNGTGGVDHGVGGAWFAFGGNVRPGQKLLAIENGPTSDYDLSKVKSAVDLKTGADPNKYIPIHVDHRDLMTEILTKHMGLPLDKLSSVYPEYDPLKARDTGGQPYKPKDWGLLGA